MDDLLIKFKALSAWKMHKLLQMEEIVPKLPEFEIYPTVKISNIAKEYTFIRHKEETKENEDMNYFNYYSNKDLAIFEERIKASSVNCDLLIKEEMVKLNVNDEFIAIESIQLMLFTKIKEEVKNNCKNLTKSIGNEKAALLLCELGSLKRLVEIPSKNLKGIGYSSNMLLEQPSYLFNSKIPLKKIVKEVSWSAKQDYFNFNDTFKNKIIKKPKEIIKKNKIKNKKRGGIKIKERKKLIFDKKIEREEAKRKKEELFSSVSSDNEL